MDSANFKIEDIKEHACRSCGNVIDIEEEGVRELDGHRIQFQEVTYQGICSVCCRSLFEGD